MVIQRVDPKIYGHRANGNYKMKNIYIIIIFQLFINCASEKDACYQDLNNPGVNEAANSCQNLREYQLISNVYSNKSALDLIVNYNLLLCAEYLQREKECKKKSKILPRWYIRS